MRIKLPKLYPITDRRLSGLSHAEQVARLCEGGARLVQLREKHLPPREFYREAEEALRVAQGWGARVVINDRADVALALGADGVHLGQDDLPPAAARELLGDAAIIGFSTHGLEQAVEASRMPVDYVAVGPVFQTSSKENPDPVVGLEGVRRVREGMTETLSLVAIGGITADRARPLLEAGADSLAVIGALLTAEDPAGITRLTRDFLARLAD
ncbi:MAG TPA: thiamine phosphate synthase [Pyrinomonadaceae bacterium]|jgi:thiamine-phosphate pyrophosphorylase|nr:thiamine phosphate synthase [Pyrinomonadaceae bacterium]